MILNAESYPFGESNYFIQFTNGRELYKYEHSHSFYEIVVIVSGSCQHMVNGQELSAGKHSVFFLRPSDTHKLYNQQPNTNVLSISIKHDFVNAFIKMYGNIISDIILNSELCYIKFDPLATGYIQDAFALLTILDFHQKEMYYNIILGKIISSFALKHYSYAETNIKDNQKTLIYALEEMQKINNIVEGIPALERISGYSRAQLCRIMKAYTGMTPNEFIHKQRMAVSDNLIQHTSMPISEIAEQVGFSSTSHFIAVFKREFGVTPAQKRKGIEFPIV